MSSSSPSISRTPVAILAGGFATRVVPPSRQVPKSMIPVGDLPFLEHQLRLLHSQGTRHVVICVAHLGEQIETYLGTGRSWGLNIEYSYDGAVALGPAGALRNALPLLGETFLVLHGDAYVPSETGAILNAFERAQCWALLTIRRRRSPWDRLSVKLEGNKVTAYERVTQEQMSYVDCGLGVMRPEALSVLPLQRTLGGVYRSLIAESQICAYGLRDHSYEIGSAQGLAELNALLKPRCERVLIQT